MNQSHLRAQLAGHEEAGLTSVKIFRRFMRRRGEDGALDAADIVSPQCYAAWLDARKHPTMHPEKAFQRTLAGHLTGSDGRKPFSAEEEDAILAVLRRRERWPCFKHLPTRYGESGFRAKGYHERLKEEQQSSGESSDSMPPAKKQRLSPGPVNFNADDEDSEHTTQDQELSEGDDSEEAAERTYFETMYKRIRPVDSDDPVRFNTMNSLVEATLSIVRTADSWTKLWDVLYLFIRLRVFARGWLSIPTDEEAQHLLKTLEQRYPTSGIVLISLVQSKWQYRFLAQSAVSREWFGRITKHDGGFTGKRFEAEDMWTALSHLLKAHTYPETEQTFVGRIRSDRGRGPSRMYRCTYFVSAQRDIIVERTELIDSPRNKVRKFSNGGA